MFFLQYIGIAQQTNELVVFTNESQPFYVIVNGIRQNENPETNVRVTNLNEDFYRLRVIFENNEIPPVDQSVYYDKMGMLYNIEVIFRRNRYRARFAGSTPLNNAPAPPSSQTQISYQQEGNQANNATPTNTPNNTKPHEPEGTHQQEQEETISTNQGNHGSVGISWSSSTNSNEENTNNQSVEFSIEAEWEFIMNGTRCPQPNVNAANLQNFIQRMEAENMFNRENMMISFIQNHCMMAQQIADLIGLDYSTVNALNVAKTGYRHTWDTQNYHLVIQAINDENQQIQLLEMLQIKPANTPTETVTTETLPNETMPIETDITPSQPSFGGYSAEWIYQGENTVTNYFGFIGCTNANRVDLKNTIAEVKKARFSSDKLKAAEKGVQGKCLTVDEILKIAELFAHESDRMTFLRQAALNTIDIDRLLLLHSALRHSSSRDELHEFISNQEWSDYGWIYNEAFDPFLTGYDGEIGKDYPLVDVELLDKNLKSMSFQSDKLILIEQALLKRSISVEQLTQISSHFRSDSDFLEMLKLVYPSVFDINSFSKLESQLRFSSSKEEFQTIGQN